MDNTSIYQVTLSNISLFKTFYMGSAFDFSFFFLKILWFGNCSAHKFNNLVKFWNLCFEKIQCLQFSPVKSDGLWLHPFAMFMCLLYFTYKIKILYVFLDVGQ